MALVESWMELAVCIAFPELPWLAEQGQVGAAEQARMRAVCRSCGVFERCLAFVEREGICGGFWAGDFREQFRDGEPRRAQTGHVHRPVGVGGAA